MDLMQLLAVLPFGFVWILSKVIFSKKNVDNAFNKILVSFDEAKKKEKFIEGLKYNYDKIDSLLQASLATIVAIFLGFKVIGILYLLVYMLISYIFVGTFLTYVKLNNFHSKVISELYSKI